VNTVESGIPGVVELRIPQHDDQRGYLIKPYQESALRSTGNPMRVEEVYLSRSRRRVVRGLHFQLPPHPVVKVVVCLEGSILDAVVDLRRGSPTEGQHRLFELSSTPRDGSIGAVVVPVGCAHGFLTTSDDALVAYIQQGEYDPGTDAGVHWSSAGIPWPVDDAIVSARDGALPAMSAFDSPFEFATAEA